MIVPFDLKNDSAFSYTPLLKGGGIECSSSTLLQLRAHKQVSPFFFPRASRVPQPYYFGGGMAAQHSEADKFIG